MPSLIKRHLTFLLPLLVLALFLTRSLWATGSVPDTHDGIYHVVRMSELWEMLKGGQFPVRYATNLDNHFGIPLFNYVYPLPYYLGLPVVALGFSPFWAVKLVTLGAYLLGGLGVYLLGAHKRWIALVAGILYLSAPYQLLNIFVRGALGETLAIGLLPWVVLAGLDIRSKKRRWYHPLPLALLFLSHSFLSFLFLPVYLLLIRPQKGHWISLMLSLGIASWYLIPALGEANLVQSIARSDFSFRYSDHFVYPLQLIWSHWGTGLSVAGTGDGISFQLGLALILSFILSSVTAIQSRQFKLPLLILCSLFLMLPASAFIWHLFSPLQLVQFPWRLLFLPTFLIPYLYLRFPPKSTLSTPILLGIALVFGWLFATPRYPQSNDQYMAQWYSNRYGTTTSLRAELLPKWVSGEPNVEYLPLHYFPLWKAVDAQGRGVPLTPSDTGQITFDRTQFNEPLTLSLHQTPLEIFANLLTLLTLVVLAFI